MDNRSERTEITADYVLNAIKETVERCMQAKPIIDATGKPVMVELSNGEFAPAYKFDANSALKGYELLGKHLKLFTDKHEVTGANGGAIKVDNRFYLSELSDKELELYEELAILQSKRDQTREGET
ncbi:terminase small subunit [Entomomonas sp. E2T0]|uniref:terminase small subunit n=1 Tax=Entomomonas sp. E2T0 TaxID=2930213 RepID=UPI00222840A4|nr:terminase small subunit [Entomomonas sp. E2T0]UYZ85589.1 terminase small subunit [Entomomonas sp. E2T0]